MPRKARIDAPGALHHVIVRGIERRKIFRSDYDRKNFLNRISELIPATHTDCFAWALLPNHVHLLLRTGSAPVSVFMEKQRGQVFILDKSGNIGIGSSFLTKAGI